MATGTVQQLLTSEECPAASEPSGVVSIGVEQARGASGAPSGGSGAPDGSSNALTSARKSQRNSAIRKGAGRDGTERNAERHRNSSAAKRTEAVGGSWTARQGP